MIENSTKVELVPGAIPTIFDSLQTINNDLNCNSCDNLISEINRFKSELFRAKSQHEFEKQALERRMQTLSTKCNEQCNKILDMKKQIKDITNEKKNISDAFDKLQSKFSLENDLLIFLRDGIKSGEKYPAAVRAFCFKLHSLSPRAYEFVRSEFGHTLPHTSTIKCWYRNSNLDSEPGINQSSLMILERMAGEMNAKSQQLVCSLTFDEMSIRKHEQYCKSTKQTLGNVSYGSKIEVANNAIVFLANGINAKIKVPVAYHFITSLNGRDRMTLLLEVLAEMFKRGIFVSNITFDGLSANQLMCTMLGASFDENNMRTYFIEPYSQRKVYIILDPSHMIKLLRTNLFKRKEFVDAEGGRIQWKFLSSLVEFGKTNNFGLTHKLTNRHIEFTRRQMHVRTAVQTLSSSVADSLQFLMEQNIRGFEDAGPTIKFLQITDRLFDIMNTQKVNHNQPNQFKSAINFFNFDDVFAFLMEAKEYIYGLKVRGQKSGKMMPIVKTRIKTGFLGFLIDIESVISLYREYVDENNITHMIPTYQLSQDHVERLFCQIRAIHRFNDNPTTQQFKGSYKRIQMASDLAISSYANISSIEPAASTNILTIASGGKRSSEYVGFFHDEDSVEEMEAFEDDHEDMCYNGSLTFVAFEIERRLLKAAGCSWCKRAFHANEKVEGESCIGDKIPSRSTYETCRAADIAVKNLIENADNHFNNRVITSVMQKVRLEEMFTEFFESEHDSDHKHFLIRFIINEYVHIKCTYLSKQKNIKMHKVCYRFDARKNYQRRGQ